jgi:hypothetical protein
MRSRAEGRCNKPYTYQLLSIGLLSKQVDLFAIDDELPGLQAQQTKQVKPEWILVAM